MSANFFFQRHHHDIIFQAMYEVDGVSGGETKSIRHTELHKIFIIFSLTRHDGEKCDYL